MNPHAVNFNLRSLALLLSLAVVTPSFAQVSGLTLSGTIHGTSGAPVAGAEVTIKNAATGQISKAQTNSAGAYSLTNVAPGDYELSVSAAGFGTEQLNMTVKAGANQTENVTLTSGLSLQDLGFGAAQTKGSAAEQARLNKRSHMLHVHQELGLITTAPLVATVLTGAFAGGRSTSSGTRDLHAILGSTTAGLYGATAYYAIFAPKIPGTKAEGAIRLHKALAWIHGPGMVLTPVLGAMAFSQKSQGERVHGIASAHGEVAIITAAAYGLAILSVSKPNLIPHSTHDFLAAFGWHRSRGADAYRDVDDGSSASQ